MASDPWQRRAHGHPTYRVLVDRARAAGMAGATVLPGPVSFGPSGHMRSDINIDAGPRAPIVVEIVDDEARILAFLHEIEALIETGLVTMERAQVLQYGGRRMGLMARLRQQLHLHPAPSPAAGAPPPA